MHFSVRRASIRTSLRTVHGHHEEEYHGLRGTTGADLWQLGNHGRFAVIRKLIREEGSLLHTAEYKARLVANNSYLAIVLMPLF